MDDMASVEELKQARDFMRWVIGADCNLVDTPDAPGRATREGGNPDAVFQDPSGNRYVVEVGRLLTPQVRQLEAFLLHQVANPLSAHVPGTFTLGVDLTQLNGGRLAPDTAALMVKEVESLMDSGKLQDSQALCGKFPFTKVIPTGHRVVPWVLGPSVACDIPTGHPSVAGLERFFERQVLEADRKLRGYQGNRILLMDIGQSGLSEVFHAMRFKDSQGVLLTWAESVCPQTQNLDFIFLELGVPVWQASASSGKRPQVYAGTKYVDRPRGFYVPLWRRPNHPPLRRLGF